jgi:hypothetical protein
MVMALTMTILLLKPSPEQDTFGPVFTKDFYCLKTGPENINYSINMHTLTLFVSC